MSNQSPTQSKVESFNDEHEAFAASRVSQYVFVPTKDVYFNTLDQHADTLEGDIKPPLVLVGNEGSGKSALLANWAAKRREHKHRDEFLFQHFVGCTTQSLELAHTLLRLETALKDFFQLREMKVPDTEVELRWSLNRFLEAASKKHSPARIVIIIDGVHRLKGDATPEGTLYWLPTELPPCVRFIVSTVEFERNPKIKTKDGVAHHTFVELSRRQCPILKVEPLGVTTRHSVINAFCHLFDFDISESQQFKIVTAHSSAQPMYLRTLLQALRLITSLNHINMDELLEKLLLCTTAHDLVGKTLNICCQPYDDDSTIPLNEYGDNLIADLLGKMLSMIYVSRSGLTEAEIWGLLSMSHLETNEDQKLRLMTIVKDYTMVVNDMYSFSHEIYREVVYSKYITSRTHLVEWHRRLARFFGQLPPCDRKLVALPYHLEKAGSWTKVKNCLTDIEMFQIWWTPKFKNDFIKFWASLTRKLPSTNTDMDEQIGQTVSKNGQGVGIPGAAGGNGSNIVGGGVGSNSNDNETQQSSLWKNRPSYDVVDEYVKSLDEFRNAKHPPDEAVAGIILEIGDFLLEFATLGHEQNADVPAMIHPKILQEDLKAIGVPYIEIDEDGRSSLVYPEILNYVCNKQKNDDGIGMMDAPTKAIEDVPVCTNYYYHRWMWIQYPYIALGNCDVRYSEGITQKLQEMSDTQGKFKSTSTSNLHVTTNNNHTLSRSQSAFDGINKKLKKYTANLSVDNKELSSSWNSNTFKLPEIKFNRKAARSIPRVVKDDNGSSAGGSGGGDEAKATSSKVMQRILSLQDSISNYREEYDFLVRMKSLLEKRLLDFKDDLVDLQRTAASCFEYDDDLEAAIKREQEGAKKLEKCKQYNKNLHQLVLMCDRHPANVPALIIELQNKIELDAYLLSEIKKRLWEQKFERQTATNTFTSMKNLVADAVEMHNKLLEYRYSLRKDLTQQAIEDEKLLEMREQLRLKKNKKLLETSNSVTSLPGNNGKDKKDNNHPNAQEKEQVKKMTWEETWSLIVSRTGILEPEAFFQRLNNSSALEQQINTIKKTSEARLDTLKKEVVAVESELEEVRYEASFAGVQSTKEHKKQLSEKQTKLKQIKEKTEAMEQLEQKVVAGLAHISDILFIPKSEEDAPVVNLIRDIEAVLDTLINEREKQLQQQQGGGGANGANSGLSLGGGLNSAGGRDSLSSMVSILNAMPLFYLIYYLFNRRCLRLTQTPIDLLSLTLSLPSMNHRKFVYQKGFHLVLQTKKRLTHSKELIRLMMTNKRMS